MPRSLRDASRVDWVESPKITFEEIQLGALLRIADATEAMAKRHTELMRERDDFERLYLHAESVETSLLRQLSAAKGQITKLKKRLAIAQTQAFGDPPDYHKLRL